MPPARRLSPRLPWLVLGLLAPIIGCDRGPWAGITPAEFEKLELHRLRGAALLQSGRSRDAAAEYRAIQKLRPRLALGYLNAAVCGVADYEYRDTTLIEARKGMDLLPSSAEPHLIEAAVLTYGNRQDEAIRSLEQAVRKSPHDTRVIGALVRVLRSAEPEDTDRINALQKRLIELAPDNLVAQVEWLRTQLLGPAPNPKEALALLSRIVGHLPRPRADTRLYLRLTREALAAGRDASPTGSALANLVMAEPAFRQQQRRLFGDRYDPGFLLVPNWEPAPPRLKPPPLVLSQTVTWTDVTESADLGYRQVRGVAPAAVGDLDLWPGAGKWQGDRSAPFQDEPELAVGAFRYPRRGWRGPPVERRPDEGSPLLVDLDNDMVLDAYVCSPAGDYLWQSPLKGDRYSPQFKVTERGPAEGRRFPAPARGTGMACAVDLDNDSVLDIVRISDERRQPPVRYLRNDGRWRLTDLTLGSGLTRARAGARHVTAADFDGDSDSDLFVSGERGSQLLENRGQNTFRDASGSWGLGAGLPAFCAAVADYNRDRTWDVAVAGVGLSIYSGSGTRLSIAEVALRSPGPYRWVEWLDFDNDSWLDLAVAGPGAVHLLRNERGHLREVNSPFGQATRWLRATDFDLDGDLDLILVTAQDEIRLLRNEGGNTRPWLRMEFPGHWIDPRSLEPGWETRGNNSYGIGSSAEVITVRSQQRILVDRPVLHLGLGDAGDAVAVFVRWPHGETEATVSPEHNKGVSLPQRPQGW